MNRNRITILLAVAAGLLGTVLGGATIVLWNPGKKPGPPLGENVAPKMSAFDLRMEKDALLRKIESFVFLGKKDALGKIETLADMDPDDDRSWELLGDQQYHWDQWKQSAESYGKGIAVLEEIPEELRPDSMQLRIADLQSKRGQSLCVMKDYAAAVAEHEKAVETSVRMHYPQDVYHYRFGRALGGAKRWKDAIWHLEEAVNLGYGDRDRRLYQDLAILYQSCDDVSLRDPRKAKDFQQLYEQKRRPLEKKRTSERSIDPGR